MKLFVVAVAALMAGISASPEWSQWGFDAPTNEACAMTLAEFRAGRDRNPLWPDTEDEPEFLEQGWYADRTFSQNLQCSLRQVRCTAPNVLDVDADPDVRYCDAVNQFYIGDGEDATCVDSTDANAAFACGGVSIECNKENMRIEVLDSLVFGEDDAELQFGGPVGGRTCQMADNEGYYSAMVDLTSGEWDRCGVTRELQNNGDDTSILYTAHVLRWPGRLERFEESHNGVTVTREKCFMVTACCYYNDDGTVDASFYPSAPNVLSEEDKNVIDFQLEPRTCDDHSADAAPIAVQSVYVQEPVCFRASITDETAWHDNIRISTRRCWATNFADAELFNPDMPLDGQKYYPLSNQNDPNDGDIDGTFVWECNANDANDGTGNTDPMAEDFSFEAFRWQNPLVGGDGADAGDVADANVNYIQTIYVFCEVNACEANDVESDECTPKAGCEGDNGGATGGRRKRAAHSTIGQMTKTVVGGRMMVMPKPIERQELVSYNLMADSLAIGMFAVGCVLAVVAIGLFVALKRTRAQARYSRYV